MRGDDPSRLLMVAGMVTAVVGVILVGIGRHAGYHVAAAVLTLLGRSFCPSRSYENLKLKSK